MKIQLKLIFTYINISLCTFLHAQEKPVKLEEFIYEKAPFKSCHAPTIVESESGLMAAWFGGTHEKHKDVEIWISRKQQNTWTDPVSVANGIVGNKRYPCWNPVLYRSGENIVYLFYKVGPSPSEWWGMLKYSTDNGSTWSAGSRLPDGILGPVKNKPEMMGNNLLLCPSSTEHKGWKVQMERFHVLDQKWEEPVMVDYNSVYNVIQPTILIHGGNKVQILCRSKEGLIITSFSRDNGKIWSDLEPIDLPNPNSGIDAITLKNRKHLLVYNHTDIPKGKWGGNRYPLNIAVSKDGLTWNAALILEDQEGEYSYPAVIQSQDGLVHVLYTWKRVKIKHVVIDPGKLIESDIEIWNEMD